ncbi:hypothetical protein GCM10025886_19780 [Tetragenococcus halophilus subsp. flandriensis]|uniref:DUF2254 domain-containing protein n=1 Tax=Tetragenococcus halophilus TaxID=51669 RepID=UPI0023EA4879|nr:DUF2254 domain-containing protein [Tetragenococcus halophilus]GMA08827.1 hypothetical protein GCM10025886_19780 [Tetragenococcus halophilus subsp. flandriensis]
MKQIYFRTIRENLWFLPIVYGLCSVVTASVITNLDGWLVPKISSSVPAILLADQDMLNQLYSALITAMLTMITISFSTIMVVLTTYSSQFSPRVLQDFMQSKITQHVLGVFTFGFLFVLVNLWLLTPRLDDLLSPFFTIVVTIISLGFFILFIHHSSRWSQVNFLIGTLRDKTSKTIRETFVERTYGEHKHWDLSQIENMKTNEKQTIYSRRAGYIQHVNYKNLINWATRNDMVLEATFQVGDYVPQEMPVFYFWSLGGNNEKFSKHDYYLVIGDERTDRQDISFSIEKLVEIAVKGLSPSMNDPNTATNAIHRIGGLLSELAGNYRSVTYFSDDNGDLRLIMEQKNFQDYLFKSFYQIKHYGKDDISVVYNIIDTLYKVAIVSEAPVRKEVWDFTEYVLEDVDVKSLPSMDYHHLKDIVEKFAQLYGEELNWEGSKG